VVKLGCVAVHAVCSLDSTTLQQYNHRIMAHTRGTPLLCLGVDFSQSTPPWS
jgi:hypothetical protein